ncbi:MAG: hypothetical protein Q8P02_03035 [Candidatus Micrarchaeota archaeon]|nr:hypothetical protein [Candidatus Micrarchaeota archaeon]
MAQLAKRRELYVESFCEHIQALKTVYHINDAVLALNGLVQDGLLPSEVLETKSGTHLRNIVESTSAQTPVKHGLNVLLWEQAIRRGKLGPQAKKHIRTLYLAHFHQAVPLANSQSMARIKKAERHMQGVVLDLAESKNFKQVMDAAKSVSLRVRTALGKRPVSPHRQFMAKALNDFDVMLSHLEDGHEFRHDLRRAWQSGAKPF